MKEAYAKLTAIQASLNVPKKRFNKFGGYAFRSAEDIMDAVKPLLKEHGCALLVNHELVMVGERYYNRATATLVDLDSGDSLQASDYAREDAERKGMTGDQLSGCASSYAAKYALKSLFLLDDSDDSDAQDGVSDGVKQEDVKLPEKKQKRPENGEKRTDKAEMQKAVSRLKNAVKYYAALPEVDMSPDSIMNGIKRQVEADKSKNTPEWYEAKAAEFEEAVKSA